MLDRPIDLCKPHFLYLWQAMGTSGGSNEKAHRVAMEQNMAQSRHSLKRSPFILGKNPVSVSQTCVSREHCFQMTCSFTTALWDLTFSMWTLKTLSTKTLSVFLELPGSYFPDLEFGSRFCLTAKPSQGTRLPGSHLGSEMKEGGETVLRSSLTDE